MHAGRRRLRRLWELVGGLILGWVLGGKGMITKVGWAAVAAWLAWVAIGALLDEWQYQSTWKRRLQWARPLVCLLAAFLAPWLGEKLLSPRPTPEFSLQAGDSWHTPGEHVYGIEWKDEYRIYRITVKNPRGSTEAELHGVTLRFDLPAMILHTEKVRAELIDGDVTIGPVTQAAMVMPGLPGAVLREFDGSANNAKIEMPNLGAGGRLDIEILVDWSRECEEQGGLDLSYTYSSYFGYELARTDSRVIAKSPNCLNGLQLENGEPCKTIYGRLCYGVAGDLEVRNGPAALSMSQMILRLNFHRTWPCE